MSNDELHEIGYILLDISTVLMSSGASTERIRTTVNRIATPFGCTADMFISHQAVNLTLTHEECPSHFHALKRTPAHHINFSVLSGISKMSWKIVEESWPLEKIKDELEGILRWPHYSRLFTATLVGLAAAGFCRIAGGSFIDLAIVFVASMCGLLVRQQATRYKFNTYLCVYFASVTASLIAGTATRYATGGIDEPAFATSVLFLIPGVPLINSFNDIIDGNLQNGVIRGLNGFVISFSIALGLLTSMSIYQL